MRIIFLCCLFLLCLGITQGSVYAASVEAAIPEHILNANFFLAHKNQYIILHQETTESVFGKLDRDSKRIRQIATKHLEQLNIFEGSNIQSIDISSGGIKLVKKIGKESTVLLMPATLGDQQPPYWPRFNLVLTEKAKEIEKLILLPHESSTGFAYVGNKLSLSGGTLEEFRMEQVPKNDPLWTSKEIWELKSDEKLFDLKIHGHRLIVNLAKGGKSASGLIEISKDKYYFIPNNNSMVSKDGKSVLLGEWIAGVKALYFEDEFGIPGCKKLVLIEPKSVSQINFPCRENK